MSLEFKIVCCTLRSLLRVKLSEAEEIKIDLNLFPQDEGIAWNYSAVEQVGVVPITKKEVILARRRICMGKSPEPEGRAGNIIRRIALKYTRWYMKILNRLWCGYYFLMEWKITSCGVEKPKKLEDTEITVPAK